MADMWHYTSLGTQMEPVTEAELKRLASLGLLRPTDLVWKEGMPDWIRASSAKELFSTDRISTGPTPRAEILEAIPVDDFPTAVPVPPRRMRRRDRYDDDLFDDDPRPRRRGYRHNDAGMSGGKIALIVVGSILGVVVLVGILFSAIRSTQQAQIQVKRFPQRPPRAANPPIFNPQVQAAGVQPRPIMGPLEVGAGGISVQNQLNLNDGRLPGRNWPCKVFTVNMIEGKNYIIREESNELDSFLILQDENFVELAADDDGGGFPTAQIVFAPPRTGTYRVIASSAFGTGTGGFTLSIREN